MTFLFKFFLSPAGKHFDDLPAARSPADAFSPMSGSAQGGGRVVLASTVCDPLGEVPVGSVIGCMHGFGDNTMRPGRVVRRVWNAWRFLPQAFFKMDAAVHYLASLGKR